MAYLNISLAEVQAFLLIFLRVGAILLTVPIFSSSTIPLLFKVGLSFTIGLILYPILNLDEFPTQFEIISFGAGVISEIILGVIIGTSVRMVIAGVQLAGQLVGFQMGLALANIVDPTTSEQLPLLGELNNIIALLIFLAINAHHWFLRAIVDSFQIVPPFSFQFSGSLMDQLVVLGGNMFIIAIKVGAPVIAALFLTTVAFGVAARAVPQMNIFFVAMPLKILVGLLFFGFSLPYMSSYMKLVFAGLESSILHLLRTM